MTCTICTESPADGEAIHEYRTTSSGPDCVAMSSKLWARDRTWLRVGSEDCLVDVGGVGGVGVGMLDRSIELVLNSVPQHFILLSLVPKPVLLTVLRTSYIFIRAHGQRKV